LKNIDCAIVFISFKLSKHEKIKIMMHRIGTCFDKMGKFPDLEKFGDGPKNDIFIFGLIDDFF